MMVTMPPLSDEAMTVHARSDSMPDAVWLERNQHGVQIPPDSKAHVLGCGWEGLAIISM